MKPTSFRLIILVVAIVSGVAVSVFLSSHNVSDQLIPPIDDSPPIETTNYQPVRSVVISIPADGEFYVGKKRLDLSQISNVVTSSLISIPSDEYIVYVKSATGVKAETLALVINEVTQSTVPPNTRLERTRR
jgi:biopolymer transport protein ExbD